MCSGVFASAKCKADHPDDGKDDRDNPQQMNGETRAEQDQYEEQSQEQNHFEHPLFKSTRQPHPVKRSPDGGECERNLRCDSRATQSWREQTQIQIGFKQ